MTDKIEAKIDLEKNAPARVALEIARYVEAHDGARRPKNDSPEYRAYFLDLYAECLRAAKDNRRVATTTEAKAGAGYETWG